MGPVECIIFFIPIFVIGKQYSLMPLNLSTNRTARMKQTGYVMNANPRTIEVRGIGGCGAAPYMKIISGSFDHCASQCVAEQDCIKFQRNPADSKCYLSDASSGDRSPVPAGVGTWQCGFIRNPTVRTIETRGIGGCGAAPYMKIISGSFDHCASQCVATQDCIKFQRNPADSKCYLSDVSSGVRFPEPSGVGTWECGFIKLSIGKYSRTIETKGKGGCGASPYMKIMSGNFDHCASQCLLMQDCIKFQRNPADSKCYLSDLSSGVQSPEPSGGGTWECGFVKSDPHDRPPFPELPCYDDKYRCSDPQPQSEQLKHQQLLHYFPEIQSFSHKNWACTKCCSGRYSHDKDDDSQMYCGLYKNIMECWSDGTRCGLGTCGFCCTGRSQHWWSIGMTACGYEPCFGSGRRCAAGTSCKRCCNGSEWKTSKFSFVCK